MTQTLDGVAAGSFGILYGFVPETHAGSLT